MFSETKLPMYLVRPKHVAELLCQAAGLTALVLAMTAPVRAEDSLGGAPILPKGLLVPAPVTTGSIPAPAPPAIAPAAAQPAATAPATTPAATPTGGAAPLVPPAGDAAAAPKPKPRVVVQPPKPVDLPDDPRPTLTPETYQATIRAAERYRSIATAGGWPALESAGPLKPGAKGPEVAGLKRRLVIEGDLAPEAAAGDDYSPALQAAVKRFQARHMLPQSGIAAAQTIAALNVPAEQRVRQLEAAVMRLSTVQFPFGERYVVVNIPNAAVETVENGKVYRRYVAVAGDPKHHSPSVETKVTAVNFNPTWTVPTSIIKNEIIPKMRKDRGYLAKNGLQMLDRDGNVVDAAAIDWSGNAALGYTVRQPEGVRNALGQIRIDMPNSLAVYMHDTPTKRAFSRNDRFLSHGCVRVSDVRDLATWLLQESNGDWSRRQTDEAIAIGDRKTVRLNKPIPVIWTYLTAFARADGTVEFRDDVYGLDATGASPGQAAPIASAQPTTGLW